ncbi:putative oxidoreductase protein [Novosphingobium sp. Rr 2-17]|uniref:SDR family oxidoreductase n=1 Tax=Novosphingobium sp. Rr 2-17 TaxID=555793 RepID=UPI0002699E5D|nr:SDR family oxidoreductase [Novosphingobium sp. Rr 2-17]EIZ80816.1 putative oxidoreductase protein [Novosphingobium sp. Rr 2-17]
MGSAVTRPSVLITGGAKRIGAAIARAFAGQGWHVVIHYGTSRDAAEALAAQLPSAEILPFDLAAPEASVAAVTALARRLKDWRVLVNSAGLFDLDTAQTLDPDVFTHAMQVNAAAPARLGQIFLAQARASGGKRLIQITDQKLLNPNPDFFSYTMSKHAVAATIPMLSMARLQARDRVYGLAPGAVLASHDQTEAEAEVSHRLNLLRRRTRPEDVAEAALFLAGGWLASGETLYLDSGQHLLTQPRDVLFLARERTDL